MEIEVGEAGSAIVVRLSGRTDISALEPLSAAIKAAASEGRQVVVDLDGVAGLDAGGLSRFIDQLDWAADHIRFVARHPDLRARIAQAAPGHMQLHPTVAAAADHNYDRCTRSQASLHRDGGHDCGSESDLRELRDMFAQLETQYRHAINSARRLLDSARADDRQDA